MERPRTTLSRFSSEETFIFKQRSGMINWREIQSLDIDEMVQKGDISKLSELLENLTFANIEKSDLDRFPDTFILKLFKLSQFALELLQEKKAAVEVISNDLLQEKNAITHTSKMLEEQLKAHTKSMTLLSREIGHKKKMLTTYEHYLLRQPTAGSYLVKAADKEKAIKCQTCGKYFGSFDYYNKHIERRHKVSRPNTAPVVDINQMKSSLEVQLKEIQEHQLKEITEFKAMLQTQLIEIKQSKESILNTEPKPTQSLQISSDIERERKELIEMKMRKQRLESMKWKHEEEIRRYEEENSRLMRNKEQLMKKLEEKRLMDSQKFQKPLAKDEANFSTDGHNRRKKLSSESGDTIYVNALFHSLEKDHAIPVFAADQSKDEDNFNRNYTPNSERMSPTFKEHTAVNKYFWPVENPEAQDIISAAEHLGIDPVKETQYLYLARDFLRNPIPKAWVASKDGERAVFKNKTTGEVQEEHPGIIYFNNLYKAKKQRKGITFDKVKTLVSMQRVRCLEEHYPGGIYAYFIPEENAFRTQKAAIDKKIQEVLYKMKNISNQQLNKINEEREKIFNERGAEFRQANEMISSELLRIFKAII